MVMARPKTAFGKRVSAPGCDDAPVVLIHTSANPKVVTLVYPFYENPEMLRRHIEHWRQLPHDIQQHLRAVIIDDGSPMCPAVEVLGDISHPFPIKLFRLDVDVRWNWLAARNIGVSKATGFCLLTDMDHIVPEQTLIKCVYGEHDRNIIYRFLRREHTGEAIHPHPNSWFVTTDMFWNIGGYDEALSGHYGTDGEFRRRAAKAAPIRIMTDELVRYEHIGDSSTVRYQRKQPEDAVVSRMIAARGRDWQPKLLSFPYHEVAL